MKRTDTTSRRCFWPLLLALGLLVLPACGGDDEDDIDPNVLIGTYDGTYDFEVFVFEPDAPEVTPANLLDTLVVSELRFFQDEDFILEYQFEGGNLSVVEGDFETGSSSVRLVVDGERARQRLLLPQEFSLDVLEAGARLEAEIVRENVDLTGYSERYANLPPLSGTLTLRLTRTSTTPQ